MTGAAQRPAAARLHGLHVLADDGLGRARDPVEQARAACAGGACAVQLRAKRAGDALALRWARAIRALTRARGALFFVNDRFDLALLSDADGVHLGQQDLPPARLPPAARQALLVGRSTHSADQARAAAEEGADYVAFGPVFGTRSKDTGFSPRGIPALAAVVRALHPRPVLAIGGIEAANAAQVADAGAAGLAVIAAVADAPDPETAARELLAAFGRGAAAPGPEATR